MGDPANDASPTPHGHITPARRHLPKVEDLELREQKDLEVSQFYASTGNRLGAYMRAQDAVSLAPDDPEAHFALAQTADAMGKKEQALTEYGVYLKLDPTGNKVKPTQKALEHLTGK